MLKKLLFSMALVLGFTTAHAQLVDGDTFVSNDVMYQVKETATEVIVVGDGTPTAGTTAGTPFAYGATVTIPDDVTEGTQTFNVTEIGVSAFRNNATTLTSIILGENVTTIGTHAFRGEGLTSITIPDSVTVINANAFRDASNLDTVNISEDSQLTTINANAFRATKVTSMYIPKLVNSIADWVFYRMNGVNLTFAGPFPTVLLGNIFDTAGGAFVSDKSGTLTAAPNHIDDYKNDTNLADYYTNFVSDAALSLEGVSANDFSISVIADGATLKISGDYSGVAIYNISGAKVTTSTDISTLSSGLYIAVISTTKGSVAKKFIK